MAEKSGLPAIAAIRGVRRSFVNAVTTPPKAAPITTPTARSTTFPRNRNCLKPPAILNPPRSTMPKLRRFASGGSNRDPPLFPPRSEKSCRPAPGGSAFLQALRDPDLQSIRYSTDEERRKPRKPRGLRNERRSRPNDPDRTAV